MSNTEGTGLFVNSTPDEGLVEDAVLVTRPKDDLADLPPAAKPVKKSFFGRKPKGEPGAPVTAKPAKAKKGAGPALDALPIQVLMGYLPEVTERDALEYAMGLSDKYLVQEGLSFFIATKYGQGYIYEVHEGGAGKAYGPEIAKYLESAGPFNAQEPQVVYLATAQRLVEVVREREGISAVLLPESTTEKPTEWLRPKKAMTPGVPRRKGMLWAGLTLFITGAVAAGLSGTFFRLQGYAPPPAQPVERVAAHDLPLSQWQRLQSMQHVKALRYKDGAWQPPEQYSDEDLKAPAEPLAPAVEAPATAALPATAPAGQPKK